jgi:predicted ribosome quality control (RQC) complex YloA/Tae2 family protein
MKAGLSEDVASDDITDQEWQALHQQWRLWLEVCEDESKMFTATKCSATGRISVLGTFDQPCASVQESVSSLYDDAQAAARFDQLKATLQRAVKTAQQKLIGKIGALEKQKSAAVQAEATHKLADLFMSNVYQWPKNALEMKVDDWETGALAWMFAHAHMHMILSAMFAYTLVGQLSSCMLQCGRCGLRGSFLLFDSFGIAANVRATVRAKML